MFKAIKNLIRWARISRPGVGTGQFPVQQVTYLGKTGNCVIMWPYGLFADVPADNPLLMFSVQAQPENRAGVAADGVGRPTLAAGEVALYHPGTGAIVKMASSGDVEITAANVKITGDAEITGDLVVSGKDFITHTHGINSGSSAPGPTGPVS